MEREERIAALREARRILREGGIIFTAVVSRFASAIDGLFHLLNLIRSMENEPTLLGASTHILAIARKVS
jgi:hypothetical protein